MPRRCSLLRFSRSFWICLILRLACSTCADVDAVPLLLDDDAAAVLLRWRAAQLRRESWRWAGYAILLEVDAGSRMLLLLRVRAAIVVEEGYRKVGAEEKARRARWRCSQGEVTLAPVWQIPGSSDK